MTACVVSGMDNDEPLTQLERMAGVWGMAAATIPAFERITRLRHWFALYPDRIVEGWALGRLLAFLEPGWNPVTEGVSGNRCRP